MRTLDLPAGKPPREWGRIHGESFRGEVRALATLRTYLCMKVGAFTTEAQVMAAARAHLPVLERFDAGLHAELLGIAEGASVTPEEIVISNHYTDLRDLSPDPARWRPAPIADDPGAPIDAPPEHAGEPDGCSVIWAESPTGRILAQTWDMHATAIPYVMVLRIPEGPAGPAATLLSVTGCLGMAGMNHDRVAVAINNLFSIDATLGVVWSALVRRALSERTARAARDVIERAPIGSGHHYFVADRTEAYAIESSGLRRKRVYQAGPEHPSAARGFCHTNHCVDAEIEARSKVSPTSSTYERMAWLEADLARAPIADLADAWTRLSSDDGWPRSVCGNMATAEAPHGTATCGAIAMNLDSGELWAQQGFPRNVAPERFEP